MQIKRVVVTKPNKVMLEDATLDAVGVGQVFVKARLTLISSGTERAFYTASPNTDATYPLYPGNSMIGEVEQVGAGVVGLNVGDRVVCPAAHASHVLIDATRCLRVPKAVDDETAVFFNLAATAMQGVRKARIELGEGVLVLGAGLIGLFATQLARLSGALPTITSDIADNRLVLAKNLGADHTYVNNRDLAHNISMATDTEGVAVVIEATGEPSVVVDALRLAAPMARIVLLGSTRGETDGVNFYRDVHRKGLHIIGGHEMTRPTHDNSAWYWTQVRDHATILRLFADNRLAVDGLVSHRFAADDFPKAYKLLADRKKDTLGMVIQW